VFFGGKICISELFEKCTSSNLRKLKQEINIYLIWNITWVYIYILCGTFFC